jgi:hypothetical protein
MNYEDLKTRLDTINHELISGSRTGSVYATRNFLIHQTWVYKQVNDVCFIMRKMSFYAHVNRGQAIGCRSVPLLCILNIKM